eukprot:TRINITY_DN85212_c0_g1_i1.p1 TRINITY_DN85212_c0_g1~~TRINITY_DN85212_c0_g1_i1.p1  ORF type:complete len:135 (+),score=7.07 TRINITY_DN85212_c0_g1_i1:153-557(+)
MTTYPLPTYNNLSSKKLVTTLNNLRDILYKGCTPTTHHKKQTPSPAPTLKPTLLQNTLPIALNSSPNHEMTPQHLGLLNLGPYPEFISTHPHHTWKQKKITSAKPLLQIFTTIWNAMPKSFPLNSQPQTTYHFC